MQGTVNLPPTVIGLQGYAWIEGRALGTSLITSTRARVIRVSVWKALRSHW
jgi:hypothetical protein